MIIIEQSILQLSTILSNVHALTTFWCNEVKHGLRMHLISEVFDSCKEIDHVRDGGRLELSSLCKGGPKKKIKFKTSLSPLVWFFTLWMTNGRVEGLSLVNIMK